jgi:hypothetical protein
MSARDLRKTLKETLEVQEELYEFIEECIKEIFPDDWRIAQGIFDDRYEYREFNGIISLKYLKEERAKDRKIAENLKAKRDELNNQ